MMEAILASISVQASRVMIGRASLRLRVELMVRLTLTSVSSRRALRRDCSKSQVLWMTLRRLRRQRLQQFLVGFAESVLPVGVHVEHAAHFAHDFQGDGQFRAHFGPQQDVARVAADIAHADRLAVARHPAGDALAHAQPDLRGLGRQAGGGLDFQQVVVGIEQDDRAAGGAHQPHRFLQDQLAGPAAGRAWNG